MNEKKPQQPIKGTPPKPTAKPVSTPKPAETKPSKPQTPYTPKKN